MPTIIITLLLAANPMIEEEPETDIERYPLNEIFRIDDDFNLKTNYVQVHDVEFECSFIHGSKEERDSYAITSDLKKYFGKRYFLFSMFDSGIQIDRESWYSVVAEPISKYLCERLLYYGVTSVFEPFSGVGGLSIHFSGNFSPLLVNDIDKEKIKMLKNNLRVYGKGLNLLKFMNKDIFDIPPSNYDCAVVCPPWGGINISEYSSKDLDEIMRPQLSLILTHCKQFSQNMVIQMPKNTNLKNLMKVVNMCNICPLVKIEKIMVNGKSSQLFVYLGQP